MSQSKREGSLAKSGRSLFDTTGTVSERKDSTQIISRHYLEEVKTNLCLVDELSNNDLLSS